MSEGKYQLDQMQAEHFLRNEYLEKAFNQNLWVKPSGFTIAIKDMDEKYLSHCIKMIEDGRAQSRQQWHELLSAELVKRQAKVLENDDELIHEMKDEIAKLKSKVNRLEQKLASKQTVIDVFNETSAKKRDIKNATALKCSKTAELKRIKCKGVGDNDGFFEL